MLMVDVFRRHSSLGFSSTAQTLPLESNPPFLDRQVLVVVVVVFFLLTIDLLVTLFSFRVAPTSTSSTSLAVDQVFLFINPSYLSNQHTQVGIYDNKQKFETFKQCIWFFHLSEEPSSMCHNMF